MNTKFRWEYWLNTQTLSWCQILSSVEVTNQIQISWCDKNMTVNIEVIKFWDNSPILLKVSDQIHVEIILYVDLGFKSVRIQFICWVERLTVFYFLFSLFFSCQIPELTSSSNHCPSRSLGNWFYSCNTCKTYFNYVINSNHVYSDVRTAIDVDVVI